MFLQLKFNANCRFPVTLCGTIYGDGCALNGKLNLCELLLLYRMLGTVHKNMCNAKAENAVN